MVIQYEILTQHDLNIESHSTVVIWKHLAMKMHPLTSPYYHSSSMNRRGHVYNEIGCQFLICESCFWTTTITR